MKEIRVLAAVMALAMAGVVTASAEMKNVFADGETFYTGCNYWASNAGMYMWRRWDAKTVEKDIAELSKNGVNVMRVFPLWPDFQPLTRLLGGGSSEVGFYQKDQPLSNEAAVDEEMMRRFRFMCDVASKHDVKLVVGLLTGWMSGRMFLPQGLEGRNVLTDPECILWEVRFVRHFVREMKDHPAIAAWDLGNECNCMASAGRAQFWSWMYQISSAIRLEDATRPVVSGMHSISTNVRDAKNLYDQGELMDVLTTHPYPLFTPECAREPFNSMRSELHPSAESLLYAGVSGRPCFVEEAGDLGRCTASPEHSAAAMRTAMWSSWVNGLGAYVWWCGFDQQHLDFPPYIWNAVERELGLFTVDYKAKPVLDEMRKFRAFLDGFKYAKLPARRVDAVCVTAEREGWWRQALGSFLLSRQAGFDISFADAEKDLPDAPLYLMASGETCDPFTYGAWCRVFGKAKAGATVLVTKGRGTRISDFLPITGNRIDTFCQQPLAAEVALGGKRISLRDTTTTRISSVNSKVLAADADGMPMVTVADYGKGKIVFVNNALELDCVSRGDCFTGKSLNPAYFIYREAARIAGIRRTVEKAADVPGVGLTEHRLENGATLVVAINYEPYAVKCPISVSGALGEVHRGKVTSDSIEFGPNDMAIFEVK